MLIDTFSKLVQMFHSCWLLCGFSQSKFTPNSKLFLASDQLISFFRDKLYNHNDFLCCSTFFLIIFFRFSSFALRWFYSLFCSARLRKCSQILIYTKLNSLHINILLKTEICPGFPLIWTHFPCRTLKLWKVSFCVFVNIQNKHIKKTEEKQIKKRRELLALIAAKKTQKSRIKR